MTQPSTLVVSTLALGTGKICEAHFQWQATGWQLWGWWWVITGWLFALGMTYLARFIQGKWRTMRVIEPEIEPQALPIPQSALASAECGMQNAE